MGKTQAYKVIFEPAEEGGYTVYVPSLPGCISEGDTYEEALANVKEAIKGWIEVSEQFGDEIPQGDVIVDVVEISLSDEQTA
jgi:predicted RNase H-like HicB family nuclease